MENVAAKTRASEIFAANLRAVLEEQGVSQRELARRMGISVATISDIVCSRCTCSIEMALRIGDTLKVPVADLLTSALPVTS